jgi:hypothetical protein
MYKLNARCPLKYIHARANFLEGPSWENPDNDYAQYENGTYVWWRLLSSTVIMWHARSAGRLDCNLWISDLSIGSDGRQIFSSKFLSHFTSCALLASCIAKNSWMPASLTKPYGKTTPYTRDLKCTFYSAETVQLKFSCSDGHLSCRIGQGLLEQTLLYQIPPTPLQYSHLKMSMPVLYTSS